MEKTLHVHKCAHVCMHVCVCKFTGFAQLERINRTSGSRGPAGAALCPAQGVRGRGTSPNSAVAMHEMQPGWIMDQVCVGGGDPEPPGSAFPILYKELLPRETEQKSG